ncbi:MAG TPA: SpoIIE family protein phosphatase, partial [Bacteroidia bacterium]|nr:SpoIIE family protein phosphatase [Bacteroidia bacterium]
EANKIAEDNGIDYMVAITDFGLSNVLSSTGKQRDAITHLMKAQAIFEAQGNASLVAAAQTNIGQIDYLLGAYDEAGKQLKEALIQQRKDEDDYSIMSSETTLAGVYIKSNELDSALTLLNDALRRAKNLGANDNLKDIYQALSDAYNAKGNSHLALEYYKLYSDAKDSVFNAENNRALLDVQAEYENDKKESELQDQMKENRNKTMLLVFVSCGLLLVMLVAFLIYSRSRVKHKANVVLEQAFRDLELKSAEVVEKNKEITDSIEYAKRIQETFLVPENHFRKLVQDYFIFYRPRDIVSGDFYWSSKVSDHNIFAVADCTGHGVPGAFMSVICNDFMNQVIRDLGVVSPELILRLLDEKIKHLQGTAELKDGMDIALISIDTRTDKLYFAGAHRPLVIIRNGELIELKGAKCSIGEVTGAKKTFPEQEFQLQKGDCVYLFSDGFAHQFGGPKGKKFKYRRLLETLQEMYKRPMNEQGSLLTNVFNEWKSGHEQVDDVCVLGLRL